MIGCFDLVFEAVATSPMLAAECSGAAWQASGMTDVPSPPERPCRERTWHKHA